MLSASKIETIKRNILGKKYSLSIAYVSENKSREINKKYRKKNKPTNVLSFALRKSEGEIVLCIPVIKKEARNLDKTFEQWLGFLVIHGMLHLKGHEHSSTMGRKRMEGEEKKYDQKYFNRNRRRNFRGTNSGGRILERRKKS